MKSLAALCLVAFAGLSAQAVVPASATPAFYPIGIYGVGSTNDFACLKQAGFNLIAGQAETNYLNAAQAAGLKVLAAPSTQAGPAFDRQSAARAVAQFDQHPALWAWYLIDEPDFNEVSPAEVIRAERCLKQSGARKPTALVLYQGYEALDYANITDILMVDRYPVPWLPLANFGQHVQMARLALGRNKPLMAVIQAFDWNSCTNLLPTEKNLRPPTGEEMRCMTYEALARGANGLFYYAFDAGWKIRDHPETWTALQSIVREVNDRLPLFEGKHQWWVKRHEFTDPTRRFNAALQSSITSCLLRVGHGNQAIPDGDYILAVNNTEYSLEYSFALPPQVSNTAPATTSPSAESNTPKAPPTSGNVGPVPVLGESRSLPPTANRLKDVFEKYAVHVYGPLPGLTP